MLGMRGRENWAKIGEIMRTEGAGGLWGLLRLTKTMLTVTKEVGTKIDWLVANVQSS